MCGPPPGRTRQRPEAGGTPPHRCLMPNVQRVGDGWGSPPVVRVKSPCLLENSSIAVGSVFLWNSPGTLAVVKAERPGHRIPASRSINRRTPVLRSPQVRFTE